MYDIADTIYCYPDSTILKNKRDIRDPKKLEEFELVMTSVRAEEGFPAGNLDAAHYRAIHHHLFQDIYEWAGDYRTIRISKSANMFCYPENIVSEMRNLFENFERKDFLIGLDVESFSEGLAEFVSELNAIHPFREGNGRTQNIFMGIVADNAGWIMDYDKLDTDLFLNAMIESFTGSIQPLRNEIRTMIR